MRSLLLLALAVSACSALVEHRRPVRPPIVTPLPDGDYATGVWSVPILGWHDPCPAGFAASTQRTHLSMASQLLESWFNAFVMPDLLADRSPYACPRGTKCDQQYRVSACVQEHRVLGEPAILIAQGVVSYKCAANYRRSAWGQTKRVGIYAAEGTYTSHETVVPPLPWPPVGGGGVSGSSVPAVTALSKGDSRQLGSWKTNAGQSIADIDCPPGYQRRSSWGTVDQEDTMARALVDDFFKKIALPALRNQGSAWGCPNGAKYADGDPFFPKAASVADANSKHTHTSSCFQKSPPAKGATAYMYAQGIINYYCLNSKGDMVDPERFTAVYTAAGRFTQPK